MKTVEGSELDPKYLALLVAHETPAFAAGLAFASVNGGPDWREPFLLLTNQRLIISKGKLFGKPKADYAVSWPEVSTVDNGPWNGAFNPLIQLDVRTAQGTLSLPVQTRYAADVEGAIRAGYLGNPSHPANLR